MQFSAKLSFKGNKLQPTPARIRCSEFSQDSYSCLGLNWILDLIEQLVPPFSSGILKIAFTIESQAYKY